MANVLVRISCSIEHFEYQRTTILLPSTGSPAHFHLIPHQYQLVLHQLLGPGLFHDNATNNLLEVSHLVHHLVLCHSLHT